MSKIIFSVVFSILGVYIIHSIAPDIKTIDFHAIYSDPYDNPCIGIEYDGDIPDESELLDQR